MGIAMGYAAWGQRVVRDGCRWGTGTTVQCATGAQTQAVNATHREYALCDVLRNYGADLLLSELGELRE